LHIFYWQDKPNLPSNNKSIALSAVSPAVPQTTSKSSESPRGLIIEPENVEFEGESSVHAHSIAARDLLEQTLGNHRNVRDNPKMVAALSSLRQIVEMDRVEPSHKKPGWMGLGISRQAIYELKLPPTGVILEIIRESKSR
jgi:hypothetical protein